MSDEQSRPSADERAAIEQLLAKSRRTDVPAILQAKEKAKQMLVTDPSYAALVARLDAMLKQAESVMTTENGDAPLVFKNVGAVLRYLQEEKGRQIEKSKLYGDIKKGLLRKEDRAFRQRDVDRYAGSLPLASTPDGRANEAEDRLRRKEEAEIRIKLAQAIREEKKNEIIDGKYIDKEQVYQEFAARAVALNVGLKSTVQEKALEIVRALGGDQQRTELLVRQMEELIDAACNEYARELTFEVNLHAIDGEDREDSDE